MATNHLGMNYLWRPDYSAVKMRSGPRYSWSALYVSAPALPAMTCHSRCLPVKPSSRLAGRTLTPAPSALNLLSAAASGSCCFPWMVGGQIAIHRIQRRSAVRLLVVITFTLDLPQASTAANVLSGPIVVRHLWSFFAPRHGRISRKSE